MRVPLHNRLADSDKPHGLNSPLIRLEKPGYSEAYHDLLEHLQDVFPASGFPRKNQRRPRRNRG